MNKVILMGRLTRDPNVRYSPRNNSQEEMAIARYTLAVDRRGAKDGQQSADFISCVAFGRDGEFAEKYLKQGTKVVVTGRIQTGSYTNRDGQKVYTTDVIVEEQEFAESKKAAGQQDGNNGGYSDAGDGYEYSGRNRRRTPFQLGAEEDGDMGFVEKVKNVISKLRAAGKTEKEVSEIIEQAAEAATVLKKTESPEHPEKIKAAGGENLQDALLKVGISAKEALTAFESIYRLRRQEKSNNWRKYHGLPLKRSKGGKRRGDRKRNDSNSENTGIS